MKSHLIHLLSMSCAFALALAIAFPVSLRANVCAPLDDDPIPRSKQKNETKKNSRRHMKKSRVGKSSKKRGRDKKCRKSDSRTFSKGPREKAFRERLGGMYNVRHTSHFFIMYNTDEEVVADSIFRLEKTYDAVQQFAAELGIRINYPEEKLPVILCRDLREYERQCKQFTGRSPPPGAAGLYYRAPLNFSIFYDVLQASHVKAYRTRVERLIREAEDTKDRAKSKAKMREARWLRRKIRDYQEKTNRSVMQHEIAHQLLFNFGVHTPNRSEKCRLNPLWFTEGLATHFEPAQTGSGVKRLNRRRLRAMCRAIDRGIPSLRGFVGDPTRGAGELTHEGYAWSWLLTHYLIRRKGEDLPKYVELIKMRKVGEAITPERDIVDFEKCFGKIDGEFEKEWNRFVRGYIRRVCH